MQMIKNFLRSLDDYLPADIFTTLIADFERDAPLSEKLKEYLP